MQIEFISLIISSAISILSALVVFLLTLLERGGRYRRNIILNSSLAILCIGAAITSFIVGRKSVNDKHREEVKSDSISQRLNRKQDSTIEHLKTTIALSRIEIDSTLKVLDTARAILKSSLKSNLQQQEISSLQAAVYNQITGPTRLEGRFFSYLMFNKEEKKPVFSELGLTLKKDGPRPMRYLAGIRDIFDDREVENMSNGNGSLDVFNTSLLDLFLCKLLNDMFECQKWGLGLIYGGVILNPEGTAKVNNRSRKRIGVDYLKPIMRTNSYFSQREAMRHKLDFLVIPKGAEVKIVSEKGTDAVGSESRRIIIYKKGYFDIILKVDGQMELGSVNKLNILNIQPELLDKITTYAFHISMDARFYHAEIGETEEYKQWVTRMFKFLESMNTV